MNKFMLSLALGTGLTLSLTAPRVQAAPIINTLETPSISASNFSDTFKPIDGLAATQSEFQLYKASNPVTGVMQSQVFKGSGQYADLYAYAYQVSVAPNATVETSPAKTVNGVTTPAVQAPVHLDGTSFIFNGTPVNVDLTGSGTKSAAYQVTGGQIGGITAPMNGTTGIAPDSLTWQSQKTGDTLSGTLRANFVDTDNGAPPLYSGNDSATFFVLTNQPSSDGTFVNLTSNTPQTGEMTSVYAADGIVVSPSPVPEPSTIMAWAGMAGAIALVRRVRKSRTLIA